MAKFNFSNFKESLNGLTKRAKNIKVKRSDSSRYSKGKRSAASDQSLGWRIAKYGFIGLLTFFVVCVIAGGSLFAYYVSSVPKLTENKLQSTNSSKIYDANGSLIADLGADANPHPRGLRRHLRTRAGNDWSPVSLDIILRSVFYCGDRKSVV